MKNKLIFLLSFVLIFGLFLVFEIGNVLAVDIRVTDNSAFDWIISNANITINTYNNSWLNFNGSSQYVRLDNVLKQPTKEATIFIRLNTSSSQTGTPYFFSQKFGISGYISSSKVYFVAKNSSSSSRTTVYDTNVLTNQWAIYAFTVESSTGTEKLYYYNETTGLFTRTMEVISKAGEGLYTAADDYSIGAQYAGTNSFNSFYNGKIDYVKYFNQSLEVEELERQLRSNTSEVYRPMAEKNLALSGRIFIQQDNSLILLDDNITYLSTNNGTTLTNIYNFTEEDCEFVWQSFSNYTFVGCKDNVYRSPPTGGMYNLTNFSLLLTLPNTENYLWQSHSMDETSNSDYIFIGVYGSSTNKTGVIYKSDDNFDTYSISYNDSVHTRHMHFIKVDPYTGYIYASGGDGSLDTAGRYLMRSIDNGTTWDILKNGSSEVDGQNISWQHTAVVFTPDGCRIYGEDETTGSKLVRTCDDINYEIVRNDTEPGWWIDGIIDNSGTIYFLEYYVPVGYNARMIASADNGTTWYNAKVYPPVTSGNSAAGAGMSMRNGYKYWYYQGFGNYMQGLSEKSIRVETLPIRNLTKVFEFDFNENTGTTVYDKTSNSYNGTVINNSAWQNDGILISTFINSPFLNLAGNLLKYPLTLIWDYFVSDSKPIVDYILLNNTNSSTSYNIQIYNLTNALIYYSNNSVAGSSNINSNDGNINITLPPNNSTIILDNFNLTEGVSRENSPLWISSTSSFHEESKDTKTYYLASNLTNSINVTIILTASCPQVGDTIIYTSNSGNSYTVTNYRCSGNQIIINLTNYEKASSSNVLLITYNKQPQGGGGTGEVDPSYYGISNFSLRLCELTYDSANKDTLKYIEIENIIKLYKFETGKNEFWTTIRSYIDNWQVLCSNQLNLTLNPSFVCEKIYYFIIKNNYNYNYTNDNLNELERDISNTIKIKFTLLKYYINNYYDYCYIKGYSDKLPKNPLTTVLIYPSNDSNCNLNNENSFFNSKISGIKIYIGDDCSIVNKWKGLFSFEENDGYYLTGVRVWVILFLGLIVLIIIFIRSSNKIDRYMRK